jgi:HK97 family phage prohead protease
MHIFGALTKIEEQPDGTLKVYGVASTGARDDAGEIVRPEAMKAALPDYARYPALREMHQPTAAGRTLEATVDEDGVTRIVAHVVDPVAIAKVKSKTYAGFSIGGRVLARDRGDATVITKIKLSEISLVDRPANPEAVIDLWKADLGPPPSNEAVKTKAAALAAAAGRSGAWKDYVAKARAALIEDQTTTAGLTDQGDADDATDTAMSDDTDAAGAADEPSDTEAGDDAPTGDDPAADDPPARDDEAPPDDPNNVSARLADLASSDPDALQAAHDALVALGAVCDPDNCQMADKAFLASDLAKALPRVEALERRLAEQHALIQRLAATPIPPRTAANGRAIGKADDADPAADHDDPSPDEIQKVLAALTQDERAFLLMKASLRQPIPLG